MNSNVTLKKDSWLSDGLGKPVYTVLLPPLGGASGLMEQLRSGSLYQVRVPADRTRLLGELLALGFSIINTNVELILEKLHESDERKVGIRAAIPDDQKKVADLAAKAFINDRFHVDAEIDNFLAEKIKAKWANNYFSGNRGSKMMIAELNATLIGFLLLIEKQKKVKAIDLVAVNDDYKRQGVAGEMIRETVHSHLKKGDRLMVTTQLRNTSSLRLYEKLGFRHSGASYMLHLHTKRLTKI